MAEKGGIPQGNESVDGMETPDENSSTENDRLRAECMLQSWVALQETHQDEDSMEEGFMEGYCNATWDSVYCWPFTPRGVKIMRPCAEIMKDSPDIHPAQLERITGNAIRVCAENGSWLWGNWTNYTECLESLENFTPGSSTNDGVVDAVRYILFIGSILSFLCLTASLFIFWYFKCLRCDRVTVHIHLMLSLALRFVLLILITEPFIFHRSQNYRKVDWVCKSIMCLLMYATVASINWMFVQGHYLHGRLTTKIFDRSMPFKIYYSIGWGVPFLLVLIWSVVMETQHPVHCWETFTQQDYIWILVGPMMLALFINLLFLINIMRILLTKIQRANTSNDTAQFRKAVKATAILLPLLGINNLLFVYNPGGGYENVYMISNTLIQSSQGIFVSILYCFVSTDVRSAIAREYRRYTIRRSANSMRRQTTRRNNRNNTSIVIVTGRPGTSRAEGNGRNSGTKYTVKIEDGPSTPDGAQQETSFVPFPALSPFPKTKQDSSLPPMI